MNPNNLIAKNFIYNTVFKIFQLITPIITVPYVARVLGSDGVGAYAFTLAVLGYFAMFSVLGIPSYGNRSIAYVRESIEQRSKVFWEIMSVRLVISSIALAAYIAFILTFGGKYKTLYLIQIFAFLSSVFDVSWFFQALEDFKRIVIRDILIRVISIILIFTLVKTHDDLNIYAAILSVSAFISAIYICFCLKGKIILTKIDLKGMTQHLKPIFILFIPVIGFQVYTLFDRILLGVYVGVSEVGNYEMAQKIIMIASTVTMTLSAVMYPRMSNLFAKKDFAAIKSYTGKSFRFLNFISIPMVFGLIAVADDFAPWFLGHNFHKVPLILGFSSVLIFLNGWGASLAHQIILPMGREKDIAINAVIGAVLSLILNLLLIPHFQAVGAAIAAIITGITLRAILIYIIRDFLPFREMFKDFWKYLFASLIMFAATYYIGVLMPAAILTTFVQVLTGFIIYAVITFVLKCEMNSLILQKALQMSGLDKKFSGAKID